MPEIDPKLAEMLESQEPRLEPLLRWVLAAAPDPRKGIRPRTERLMQLHEALQTRGLLEAFGASWGHASAIRLLAETGLPDRTNFLGELFLRLVDKVIPRLDPEWDLYALLNRLDLDQSDSEWIASLPASVYENWAPVLVLPRQIWIHAARLLAHRASALGLSRDLLAFDAGGSDADSPFFELSDRLGALGKHPDDPEIRQECEARLEACHSGLRTAHARMDECGISTDLAFRLELLEAQLTRIARLMGFATGSGDGRAFAVELVRGSADQCSLSNLLRNTLKRLARRMVEHSGATGEHYIARNRHEWWAMGRSAAGGGLLTSATALLKYGLQVLPLAPLLMGLGLAANYAFGFCLMQLLGFSLASKQPAMTAAALAGALELEQGTEAEVDLVAAITRTQTIATLGNVLVAIPAALLLAGLWILAFGHGPLSPETALHSLQANHPFHGWTLVFAAGSGVLLWVSSLASGWVANWSAYRRLPEALAGSHRLQEWLGTAMAEAVGRFVRKHLAGFAGYIVLGLLLGFTPQVAAFAGITLEVRHVTFQAASLALASVSMWTQGALPWVDVLWGLLGVALVGVANFSVSFGLALWTAIRARDLDVRATIRLMWALLLAFNRAPLRFLWAPPAAKYSSRSEPMDPPGPCCTERDGI